MGVSEIGNLRCRLLGKFKCKCKLKKIFPIFSNSRTPNFPNALFLILSNSPLMIQLVVFDMAGTTVDEGKTVYKSVQKALANAGYEFPYEEVLDIAGMNKQEGIEILLGRKIDTIPPTLSAEIHDDFLRIVNAAYRSDESLKEKTGASKVFQALHDRGIKVVLDTGYHRPTAEILIERMGWRKAGLIDMSITSDEVESGRPHPFMIQKAMKQFGITDAAAVAKVGDTLSDIAEGRNAGCGLIVAITTGAVSEAVLAPANPDACIAELEELLGLI